jgi:hypothetical protein
MVVDQSTLFAEPASAVQRWQLVVFAEQHSLWLRRRLGFARPAELAPWLPSRLFAWQGSAALRFFDRSAVVDLTEHGMHSLAHLRSLYWITPIGHPEDDPAG